MNKKIIIYLKVTDKHFGNFEERKEFTSDQIAEADAYLDEQRKHYGTGHWPLSTTATLTIFNEDDKLVGFEQLR